MLCIGKNENDSRQRKSAQERKKMKNQITKFETTSFGKVAYSESGDGDVAVFVHGLGLSSHFWRHQFAALNRERRCIAPDLMAHGETEIEADQDVSFHVQADMILELLDKLNVERFDLVGNDNGGAIAQLMIARAPERVRSLVLTNCDVQNNWPPVALGEIREAARSGVLAAQFGKFAETPDLFRADGSIAELVYEDRKMATDDNLRRYLAPLNEDADRRGAFDRYVGHQDHSQLTNIEADLRAFEAPALIVWGTDDVFFPTKWAYWLQGTLPNAQEVIELEGAKLFFPEERAEALNSHIHEFWSA
jgi:pimeloyl-ACP methyl ester carboxylesterase